MKKIFLFIILLSVYSFGQTNRLVRFSDLTDSLNNIRNLIGTGGVALPDSVIFTSELTPYVDKTSIDTITGEKNFKGGIKLSDTTNSIYFYNPFTAPYGFYRMRSWNAWVNTDGRPDVGFGLGYNLAAGGGRVDTDDIAFGMMMESHYDGNGYTASELHLMNVGTNNVQYRFLTADFNKTTNSTGLRLQADKIFMGEDNGDIIWYMTNGSIQYYQPYFSMYPNNSSMIANWNKDSTAWVFLPYLDNNDRYTFGNIDTVTAGNPFLHLYQMGLRFDNTYGFSSYNSGGTLTKNFYYDSDELRIQADTTEPVKIRASNLYFEDAEGGLTDIINPALPFDTTGLEAGAKYVDLNTGQVLMRVGENLVSNGDFSSWTWDATSFRHPTGWIKQFIGDTTQTYIENVSNQLHIVSDGSARLAYLYNATSLSIGETYVYSFNLVGFTADSLSFQIGGVPLNPNYTTLSTGYKTGEITATGVGMFSFDCQLASADVTIDNLRIWKKTGGAIQAVADIISLPDTVGETEGYVPKLVGGNVVWSPDISTSGTGTFNPDGVTIDTTAGGLARVLPAKVTEWDSVTYKANTSDFAIAPALLDDSLTVKMNRSEMTGYSTTSHTHIDFFDTLTITWGVLDTTYTGSLSGWKVPNDITITEISAYTDANTCTFNLEERAETTPNSAGTDVMGSDLVADTDQQETSTFTNATISKNTWLVPTISATGDVSIFSISVRYIKTD